MFREGSGEELVESIAAAPRAIVFISVPWSIPERHARVAFQSAVAQFENTLSDLAISSFRLEVDEDEKAQNWLSSVGYLQFAVHGSGSLLWLESGKVVSSAITANALGAQGIISRTTSLWQPEQLEFREI